MELTKILPTRLQGLTVSILPSNISVDFSCTQIGGGRIVVCWEGVVDWFQSQQMWASVKWEQCNRLMRHGQRRKLISPKLVSFLTLRFQSWGRTSTTTPHIVTPQPTFLIYCEVRPSSLVREAHTNKPRNSSSISAIHVTSSLQAHH